MPRVTHKSKKRQVSKMARRRKLRKTGAYKAERERERSAKA